MPVEESAPHTSKPLGRPKGAKNAPHVKIPLTLFTPVLEEIVKAAVDRYLAERFTDAPDGGNGRER